MQILKIIIIRKQNKIVLIKFMQIIIICKSVIGCIGLLVKHNE